MSGFTPSTAMLAGTAEPLLIAVIGLLALVIVGLAALALLLRRRNRAQATAVAVPARPAVPVPATPAMPRPRPRPAQHQRGSGGGGLAVATSSAMVCPTCRTEYHGMTYCTRDARRLVPPEDMLGGPGLGPMRALSRSAGLVCMACRRAYEPGLRSCPHDGNELVPFPVYNATRPRRAKPTEPAGVIARICPVCGSKYDLNARFCGHDAGQLVVIN
jgi:RNA polymerase subunit RPABC4/transcription elongation factor Spt4